jgi:hypothetical protein
MAAGYGITHNNCKDATHKISHAYELNPNQFNLRILF